MPIIPNNNPFSLFFNCKNTYAVFLKLEQDINNNIPVPFYFKPRERHKLSSFSSVSNEEYMAYVNTTLKASIIEMLHNYGDNYKVIEKFQMPSTYTFGVEFKGNFIELVEISYNSFKTLFLVSDSNKEAILLNYFKYDEKYDLNESCCIPQLDVNIITPSQYIHTINGIHYINTYQPYLAFNKKVKKESTFWTSVENYMNGISSDESYSFYQFYNLVVIYDFHLDSDTAVFNQGF
ncbi:hypothetical protein CBU02nite_39100 [Clostridium butyricum]|uniref:Uncharacterized protein n=1 Tax=Clostridium butyricum TaxID=1492 RepID=A0A512TSZ1_CLOBU|nr:hypothetical protein [Clostridium butyricum]NOW25241.1 hypothetical protein [Clostridium butyricum]GEQ23404.1 hypothetical protein CBU02nite_39100 [Clostridium butyricum]